MQPRIGVVAMLLAGVAASGAAQQPRPSATRPASVRAAASPFGQVRGIVYDSLLAQPLPGARVVARGTGRSTFTDAGGRFALDSLLPGLVTIGFEHDSLDIVGLSNLGRQVQVVAGRLIVVELASPSQPTLRRGLCRGQAATGAADSAVIYGSVRDVATRQRLAGALVRVRWIAVQRQGPEGLVDILRPVRDVSTDSIGNYYACGLPGDLVLQVQAFAESSSTGVTEVLAGLRAVARHDLALSREPVPGGAVDTAGLRRGQATLIATVRTGSGQPRPSARVSVDDTPVERFTNEEGLTVLTGLPAGSHMVMARMVGYSAARRMVDLRNRDTLRIELTMNALTVLDSIRVVAGATRTSPLFDELEQRLRSRTAGQQLTAEQIRGLPTSRSLFQQFNSLTVVGRTAYDFRLVTGGNCPVSLFIDGHRADTQILQSYRNEQLVAVEFFPRASQAPIWAQAARTSNCGVALVWTRFLR